MISNYSSPFWAFAHEFGENMRRKGIPILSNQALMEMAGGHWSKLLQAERDKYKNKAKITELIPVTNRKIYDCRGQDIAEVEAKKNKQQEEIQAMKNEVKQLLDNANDIGGDI